MTRLPSPAASRPRPSRQSSPSCAAFSADPRLLDVARGLRSPAASASALAALGQGKDALGLDAQEKARLRRQALDWLKAELAALTKLLEGRVPQTRALVQARLKQWQRDPAFAPFRDATALTPLPEEERRDWQQLWADVAARLTQK